MDSITSSLASIFKPDDDEKQDVPDEESNNTKTQGIRILVLSCSSNNEENGKKVYLKDEGEGGEESCVECFLNVVNGNDISSRTHEELLLQMSSLSKNSITPQIATSSPIKLSSQFSLFPTSCKNTTTCRAVIISTLKGKDDHVMKVKEYIMRVYNVDEINIITLSEDQIRPTKENILSSIRNLVLQSVSEDSCFLYFSSATPPPEEQRRESLNNLNKGITRPSSTLFVPCDHETKGFIYEKEIYSLLTNEISTKNLHISCIFNNTNNQKEGKSVTLFLPNLYVPSLSPTKTAHGNDLKTEHKKNSIIIKHYNEQMNEYLQYPDMIEYYLDDTQQQQSTITEEEEEHAAFSNTNNNYNYFERIQGLKEGAGTDDTYNRLCMMCCLALDVEVLLLCCAGLTLACV